MSKEFIFDKEYELVGEVNLDIKITEYDSILPTMFEEIYENPTDNEPDA